MMNPSGPKYIFYAGSLIFLASMLILSRNAGISCDEVLHYNHSVAVNSYFTSHGIDTSALNTPETNLKYYGQFYDNLVTWLATVFDISDIYTFRHCMSALAGWLTVLVTAIFGIWLSGYKTGILVLVLFALSPTFMGHAQNNLKDIPFALSYIAGTFFILRLFFSDRRFRTTDIVLVTLSIAFSISIRSGGLILICFMYLFFLISVIDERQKTGIPDLSGILKRLSLLAGITVIAFLLGILFWPFALQSPVRNVLESFRIMAHFPSTFRQIFEGQVIWSDLIPWYYLPKSMVITVPLIVSSGFIVFLILAKQIFKSGRVLLYSLVLFTILFPVCFVVAQKSNLYSSWRQFLFIYPAIILIAATGLILLFSSLKKRAFRLILILIFLVMAIHPVTYMVKNPRYFYMYYNELTGGLRGAYGNYETDYYYVSQTEASEWLQRYFKTNKIENAIVMATFPVDWQFRHDPGIRTIYCRNEDKSLVDWDYAIITNRYIHPFKLKNDLWPPENAIHLICSDGIPVCAILKRNSKADLSGSQALEAQENDSAIRYFREALEIDDSDEMIFYNFARALYNNGEYMEADSVLKAGLDVNPYFEPILMYLGNIAAFRKNDKLALEYYSRVIESNRKYFQAYVESAKILAGTDIRKAREMLRSCLNINSVYKPAITGLADTYRETNPEIAEKYDRIAKTIK